MSLSDGGSFDIVVVTPSLGSAAILKVDGTLNGVECPDYEQVRKELGMGSVEEVKSEQE